MRITKRHTIDIANLNKNKKKGREGSNHRRERESINRIKSPINLETGCKTEREILSTTKKNTSKKSTLWFQDLLSAAGFYRRLR